MFNLGTGRWETTTGNGFTTTPSIELWGQIIQPLTFRSIGNNVMFGIRFFPHTASIFFNESIHLFNNKVTDLSDVARISINELYARLQETVLLSKRIELVEAFLLNRLSHVGKKLHYVTLIGSVMNELHQQAFYDNIENVASGYGVTARYLQKIFLQYTGLTPKLYSKIHRFQNSLQLVAQKDMSLTSIAYECGYFDQSHFIRDFKSFTGAVPSGFNPENTSAMLISPNK
jgi:AraC-like DNA-binding protein